MLSFHPSVVIDSTFKTVDLVGKEDEPMPTEEEIDLEYHREPDPMDLDGNTNPVFLTARDNNDSDRRGFPRDSAVPPWLG